MRRYLDARHKIPFDELRTGKVQDTKTLLVSCIVSLVSCPPRVLTRTQYFCIPFIIVLMKTGVFIGRFQPFHDGHRKCIHKILESHDRCIVLMRETEATDKNPFDVQKRKAMIRAEFPDESMVEIQIVTDPGAHLSVFIGRDVGYELIQLDEQTEAISATDIRKKLYDDAGKEYDEEAPEKVR